MRFIAENSISELLGKLAAQSHKVWAPQVVRDTVNTVVFAPWTGDEAVSLDAFTMTSAKELVLPATERLFSYRYHLEGGSERIDMRPAEPPEAASEECPWGRPARIHRNPCSAQPGG